MNILFTHKDFLVCHKAHGISFHSETEKGFFQTIQDQYPEKLFPLHRLDKVTSGLILIARNKEAAQVFGNLFETHQIQKYYLAISDQKPKKKQGLISGDMTASRRGSFKLLRTHNNPTQTQFFSHSLSEGKRLFLLKPLTGKTHQLRVAAKSLGSPLLGDILYSGNEADRCYLHAWKLSFVYKEESFSFNNTEWEGKYFQDIEAHLEDWQTPDQLAWPKSKNHKQA